ncbi:MAG: hypothetical protein D3916_13145, partial [Candidatus Electrothrix sp. MAN1_4]|nr:hypothetical protein [Candidatus Electrothrix sp. MAN1_4]
VDLSLSDSKGFHVEARVVTPLISPENASFWSEPSSFIEEAEIISVSSKPIVDKLLKGNEQQRQNLLNRYFNRF